MKIQARKHDTFWQLSQLFKVPERLLMDSNPGIEPENIKVDEAIHIPGYDQIQLKIKEGDSFWRISTLTGVPVGLLSFLNGKGEKEGLRKGETIIVPHRVSVPQVPLSNAYDSQSLARDLERLQSIYPFLSVKTIGKSVLGKPIQELRIGKGRRKVHINASFHANEWITSLVLMNLIDMYLLSLGNSFQMRGIDPFSFYNTIELSVVPMVNPDGVDLVVKGPPMELADQLLKMNEGSTEFFHWKANIRGIDLNNQFPAKWEIEKKRKLPKAPAPRDYPGEAPLTEPEAIVLAELAKENDFDSVIAFHTQGKEFYWGYEGYEPEHSEIIATELEKASGYKAIRNVDSHAGYKDWFIQEFRRPGFTIELGKGINPLPLSQINQIIHDVSGLFIALLNNHSINDYTSKNKGK